MTFRLKAQARPAAGTIPAGRLLAEARWSPRHRAVLRVLWLHLSVIGLVAVAAGHNLGQPTLASGLDDLAKPFNPMALPGQHASILGWDQ